MFVDEVSASLERPLLRQKQQKMKFNKEMDTPAGRYHHRQDKWLFVVWMGLKTMRIVLNEMKPSFKP